MMKEVTCVELLVLLNQNPGLYLVDVREDYEHLAFNIGGAHIPLGEIMKKAGQIPTSEPVVLYCRKGVRSAIAIQRLEEKFGFNNLVNLAGGMDAWHLLTRERISTNGS